MTADDFRRLALDLHDTVEHAHMGHPDFRTNGRIFASLHTHDRFGMVKLTPAEQREVMKLDPGVFVPSSGAWGRQGCTDVRLEAASEATVRGALLLAWQGATARPRGKPRAAPRAPGRRTSARKSR